MNNQFRLQITTDNAAFGEDDTDKAYEVARILEDVARRIREDLEFAHRLRDINGNRVGSCGFDVKGGPDNG
jgi:hypothetical protein